MSIHMAELLTLIEEAAKASRVTLAQASILSAQMDLRAGGAREQHGQAIESLRGLCGALIGSTQPMPPDANGRLKMTG